MNESAAVKYNTNWYVDGWGRSKGVEGEASGGRGPGNALRGMGKRLLSLRGNWKLGGDFYLSFLRHD